MRALFAILVPSAVLAQGLGLVWLETSGGWERWAGFGASAATALGFSLAWRSSSRRPFLSVGLVTASVGGLGMLLGAWIDARQAMPPQMPRPLPAEHRHTSHAGDQEALSRELHPPAAAGLAGHGPAALGSWMTGLMLLFCVPSCGALCRSTQAPRSTAAEIALHGIGALGMLAGMLLAAAAGGSILTHALGSALAGHHLAMIVGMCAGSALGTFAARRIDRCSGA